MKEKRFYLEGQGTDRILVADTAIFLIGIRQSMGVEYARALVESLQKAIAVAEARRAVDPIETSVKQA